MTQRDKLRALDAKFAARFKAAGMGDAASYTRCGSSSAVACTVLLDRAVQAVGDFTSVPATLIAATVFLAELGGAQPAVGDVITVGSGASAEVFVVDRLVACDESRAQCIVRPK